MVSPSPFCRNYFTVKFQINPFTLFKCVSDYVTIENVFLLKFKMKNSIWSNFFSPLSRHDHYLCLFSFNEMLLTQVCSFAHLLRYRAKQIRCVLHFLQDSSLPLVAVAVADGVPLEVGVAVLGGEGVDDERTVVVDAAAAVGLCELACSTVDSRQGKLGKALALTQPHATEAHPTHPAGRSDRPCSRLRTTGFLDR